MKRFFTDFIKSYLWFHILNFVSQINLPPPKNIGEGLKGTQRKFWKEALFVKYDKNKNFSILFDPIPIKSLSYGTKVFRSLIATRIK